MQASEPKQLEDEFASQTSVATRERSVRDRARFGPLAFSLAWIGLSLAALPATAQVVRDGSIGPLGAGLVDTETGPGGGTDYLIGEADGSLVGDNLFHSFDQFDLNSSERAIYQGRSSIQNLITRVTGGPSSIDGVIQSDIPGANLYFLNPAGVVFGENAQVDTTGAFHISTADQLLFENGDVFDTFLGGTSTLSVAEVAGFGFLAAPAPIRIHGSQIELALDQDLSLTGGDIEILGNRSDGEPAFLNARSGRIDLASLRSSGEVYLDDGGGLRVENVTARGDVTIAGNASISTSGIARNPYRGFVEAPGEGSGPVNVYAEDLTIEDADILTLTVTDEDAGDVTLDLEGDLVIRSVPGGRQSGIIAGTGLEIEPGPDDELNPFNPFVISSYATTDVVISNCVSGFCGVRYEADGKAGDVNVTANRVILEDGGRITARSDTRGAAGTVLLQVNDSIRISGAEESGERSGLSSTADSTGDPGVLQILSPNATLVMEDQAAIVIQNSDESLASSLPGRIEIDVASLEMSGDARIDSSTRGAGRGGDIDIRARDFVRLEGRTSAEEFTGITTLSQPGSTGAAGTVRIETANLDLRDGAEIAARPVGPDAFGDAGNLVLDVSDEIRLSRSSITTESENAGGGNITAFFGRTLGLEASSITSSVTSGDASGGNIILTSAPNSAAVLKNSQIIAEADQGAGGNILVEASLVVADPNSRISASSNANLDGTVVIRAPDGALVDLSPDLNAPALEVSTLLNEPCAAKRPGGANSLVVSQYEGLPVNVETVLPAFLPKQAYARLGAVDPLPAEREELQLAMVAGAGAPVPLPGRGRQCLD